ncbi:hypothetical protein ACE01N_13225 [Saccharicrinis sp. FJH2]|uniref:hypothetical protein n=1 Tax=Saccharicrinis sp. FJH65 TaxID=3344659 RepID=UPI0035F4D289
MIKKIIGVYSVFLGVSIIGMWIMILSTEGITEGNTEITFHLASEFTMALFCLISGIMLLKNMRHSKEINILGHGMVLYSVINAAGYYGERGDSPFVVMFLIIFCLSTASLFISVKNSI